MTFNRHLTSVDHERHLVITADPTGWEVREEEDSTVLSRVHRSDWHRVETDVHIFDLKSREPKRHNEEGL